MMQNIIVRLAAQGVGAFKTQMAQAAGSIKGLHDDSAQAANATAGQMRKAGLAMAAVGVAAAAAAAASAKAAMDLETRMQNVATIWTDSSLSIAEAGQRVVDMSTELPQSANNLAEGLYDIASSGFQGADALMILRTAGEAASAGLTTTAVAAKGITAVLNAYGLEASSAATVSDVLFQTVNLGVVTFEELSSQLGDFVGSASVAGINIRDAAAAFATMTLNGISAAEAGTSMNRVIQSMIQPSEALAASLQAMGYQSGLAALEALGLNGVMAGLMKQTGGGAEAMSALFPEIRALRGALALTSAQGENYNRVQKDMNDDAKLLMATENALAEQQKSTSYQWGQLKNSVVAVAISFGQALLPALKIVIGIFQAAIDIFNALPGPMQTIVMVGGLITGMAVGLAGAFLLLAPSLAAASGGMVALNAAAVWAANGIRALWASLGPVGWIVAGIGAAVGILSGIWASHAKGQAEAKRRVDELAGSLDKQTGAVSDQTEELLRKRVIDKEMDKQAKDLGVSLDVLMKAMYGDKEAIEAVNVASEAHVAKLQEQYTAALKAEGGNLSMSNATYELGEAWRDAQSKQDKLTGGIKDANKELDDAIKKAERDRQVKASGTKVTDELTRATTAKAQADQAAAEAADKHRQEMEALSASMSDAFSLTNALAASEDSYAASQSNVTDTLRQEIEDRYEIQNEAAEKAYEAEKEGLERTQAARREAIDQEHADIRAGNERIFREQDDALEREQRVRKDALDDNHRERKQGLEKVFREERRQLDRRLDLLDEEWDKRRRAEERAYEAQKEEAEFMIRTTWGAERQGWIERLAAIEEGYEAQTRATDRAQEDEANAIKDGQADSEQARSNGLDDQLQAEQQGLADILAAEKQHLKDRQDAVTAAEQTRYDGLVKHHEEMVKAENKGMDDRYEAVKKKLEDQQELENRKADERRTNAKTKRDQSLSDIIAALEQNNKDQEAKLENLRIIWERSGRNLSTEMLEELQGLEPGMVAQLAKAGPAAFDSFMTALGTSVKGVDAGKLQTLFQPFNDEIKGILARVGEFGGADMMASVAKGVANNPQGAQQLRDILAQLMAPKEVSPGVWAVPKAGGGYYPMKMTAMADGGVRDPRISRTPVLWAEAGYPEAYIPLAMSKASRSIDLLGEAAMFYGYGLVRMANGGIMGGGSSGGSNYSTANHVEVHVRVAAGVDPNAVGVAVRREVERAMDHLGRQVAVKAWRN